MENILIQTIRKVIPKLPEKDIPIGIKYLEDRNFDALQELTDSAIIKVKRDKKRVNSKYSDIDVSELERLSIMVTNYKDNL